MNPIISIDWQQLLFQAFNIFLLFLLLRWLLYKPLTNLMEQRRAEIKQNLEEASSSRLQAEALKSDYEEQISKARQEARQIVENAMREKDEIIKSGKDEAQRLKDNLLKQARQEIESEKDRAFDELKDEIARLALLAAEKIIEKEMDLNTHKNMINRYVEEMRQVS